MNIIYSSMMRSTLKIILPLFGLIFLFNLFSFSPATVFALRDTDLVKDCNAVGFVCLGETECTSGGGTVLSTLFKGCAEGTRCCNLPEVATPVVEEKPEEAPETPIGYGYFSTGSIQQWIADVWKFGIIGVILLATTAIVWGALDYVVSWGNAEKVTGAKEKIIAAIAGVVIMLIAYALLSIMNPETVNLRTMTIF